MAHAGLIVAFGTIVAGSPASATPVRPAVASAPAAGPDARYCLRVEPFTGSYLEQIFCYTREEWKERDVDVDREWAKEGVRVIDPRGPQVAR